MAFSVPRVIETASSNFYSIFMKYIEKWISIIAQIHFSTWTNMFDGGSVPRVMESANSNFYSDITWPLLPRLQSQVGRKSSECSFYFWRLRKKEIKIKQREKYFVKLLLGLVAKYIQKNVDTLTIISATFGFGNFPDNFVCN